MSLRPVSFGLLQAPTQDAGFAGKLATMAGQPLHEIGPVGPGFEAAALGFTLALAAHWVGPAGIFWAGEDAAFAEELSLILITLLAADARERPERSVDTLACSAGRKRCGAG
ncbi:MAG: hypothetical protein ABL932_25950 [Terricaulis sp.]